MSDLIRRADAMGAVQDHFNADGFKGYDDGQKMMDRITGLPSAETHEIRTETHGVCSDLISRQAVRKVISENYRRLGLTDSAMTELSNEVKSLPPVTPTVTTGEWKKEVIEKLESLMKDMENEIEDAKKHPENYTKNFIIGMKQQVAGVAHAAHEIIDMPSATERTGEWIEPVQPHQVDCTGCKFVGTYDTDFPCANCVRKTKDYYCGAKRGGDTE